MKYLIKARVEVDGNVDKSDIIGAIFGQTEGLFGPDFDLRELQDKGRIGRIIVEIKRQGGRTLGVILVPSNLDKSETALVAAMLEFVDKVGPYNARITIDEIIDVRHEKIKKITERAKEILKKWFREKTIDVREVIDEIESAVRIAELRHYGPEGLPAGPEVDKADTIIIVEGRADVLNLLRYGYKNVIALEGAKGRIPETIVRLARNKKVIAFLDGDRAGDMILKELIRSVKVDYVARAPAGREVEDLTGKEIVKALKNAVPLKTYLQQLEKEKPVAVPAPMPEVPKEAEVAIQIPPKVIETIKELRGTLEAVAYDESWNEVKRLPVRDLVDYLLTTEDKVSSIAMDGIITQRLVDSASVKGVKLIIGARMGMISKKPADIALVTFNEVLT